MIKMTANMCVNERIQKLFIRFYIVMSLFLINEKSAKNAFITRIKQSLTPKIDCKKGIFPPERINAHCGAKEALKS